MALLELVNSPVIVGFLNALKGLAERENQISRRFPIQGPRRGPPSIYGYVNPNMVSYDD
jgi:hypothetical protein